MIDEIGQLSATPPFDFARSLDFLRHFTAADNEHTITDSSLTKATCFQGQTIVFRVTPSGTTDEPQLDYTLFADASIRPATKQAVEDRIAFYLSLNDDLRPFYQIAHDDPYFAPLIEKLYGYHQVKFHTPFENACWAVISQRTALSTASQVKQRLVEYGGNRLEVDGTRYWAFPEAAQLALATRDELMQVVRNQRQVTYLQSVIRGFDGVDETFLRYGDLQQAETWLRKISGVGAWSASFILLRGLGRTEVIPVDDKRLLRAAAQVYKQDRPIIQDDLLRLAEPYGPWRGYWSHYLRAAS